jgi:integrase
MPGKQAKILSTNDVNDLLVFATCTRHPFRNRVIVLLAAKAGLRAGEIAKLTWDMVLGPTGEIGSVIELRDAAAKNGSGRLIPVHPDLCQALAAYRSLSTGIGPVVRSERGGPMTPLSIVVWFNRAFRNIGLLGCSSHSGRRTFITRAARLVHRVGGSLRDVQLLAGHRSIQTTQRYIDGDTDAQCRSFDEGGRSRSPSPCRPEAKSSSPQQKRSWHGCQLALASTRCAQSRRSGGTWCLLPGRFGQPDR